MNLKWTTDNIKKEALKYNSRGDFSKYSSGAYAAAKRLGIKDEVCSHMINNNWVPPGKWTRESILEEAKKYRIKSHFEKNSSGAFKAAKRLNIIDEACSHMDIVCKPVGYWTNERLKEEAGKYNTKQEFIEKSGSAYQTARQKGIIDKICEHMIPMGNRNRRMLYSFEFSDKSVYVGLTYNYKIRYASHMKKSKDIIKKRRS